jgi:hypothetical protein
MHKRADTKGILQEEFKYSIPAFVHSTNIRPTGQATVVTDED